MSDSNVVGRKQMSSINHIFILNGVMHETISFQIFDFSQMFDSMRLKQAISDLYTQECKMTHFPCYMTQIKILL